MSMSFFRATYPCLLARIVYHVGSPAMLDGKRFLPLTGTPMPKMLFSRTLLADCDPEPLTVATWMLKSLTMRLDAACFCVSEPGCVSAALVVLRTTSPVAIWRDPFRGSRKDQKSLVIGDYSHLAETMRSRYTDAPHLATSRNFSTLNGETDKFFANLAPSQRHR